MLNDTSSEAEQAYTPEQYQSAEWLKQQGLSIIQNVASDTWTDHNKSDPGINILEVLSFAIADLSASLSLPVTQLLAPNPVDHEDVKRTPFYLPQHILPTNQVTLDDHRKAMIDIEGVKNVALSRRVVSTQKEGQAEPKNITTGIFDITVDFDEVYFMWNNHIQEHTLKLSILNGLRRTFLAQRNVNEDIGTINVINKHAISMAMSISLDASVEPMQVVADILAKIRDTISPTAAYEQYKNIKAKGESGDEIFDGPLLKNGFISTDEVDKLVLPETVYASDILSAISDIKGLTKVTSFTFTNDDQPQNGQTEGNQALTEIDKEALQWRLDITPGYMPALDIPLTYNAFTIEIDGQQYQLPEYLDGSTLKGYFQPEVTTIGSTIPDQYSDYITAKFQQLSHYESLQKQLPAIYKLAENRLDQDDVTVDTAGILQLKGYLTLFDQVLADEHAQLNALKSLLSIPNQDVFPCLAKTFHQMLSSERITAKDRALFWSAVKNLPLTQFSQPITDLSGMRKLLGDHFEDYAEHGFKDKADSIFSATQLDRLKRSFEHTLSRFAETTLDVNLLKYRSVFSAYSKSLLSDKNAIDVGGEEALLSRLVTLKQIVDLASLLNHYPSISKFRSGGRDYLSSVPLLEQETGLNSRILRFLGASNLNQMPLATNNKEGIYLLESELIRFCGEGTEGQTEETIHADNPVPYNQLFFVVPSWPTRFANDEFRTLLERQIVKDSPIYQQPHILYLDRHDLSLFERLFYAWMNAMTQQPLCVDGLACPYPTQDEGKRALISTMSGLLRQFVHQTQTITDLILGTLTIDELKESILQWLNRSEFQDVLDGDTIETIKVNLKALLKHRLESQDEMEPEKVTEAVDELYNQILFSVCQHQIDALANPHPIREATIGHNFRIGYKPLNYLKPSYLLGNARVNPPDIDKPVFTLGIKPPLSI